MARKSMGILDLLAWIETTGKSLEGARASNFYFDPDRGVVLVKLQGRDAMLVLEGGRRAHLTRRERAPSEYKPYPLVVLLRKRLRGQRIQGFELAGNDRILRILFPSGYSVIVELLPRGIVALVGPEGKVLASSRALRTKDRVIRPGVDYVPPPGRGSLILDVCTRGEIPLERAVECLSRGSDLVRGLVRGCGVQGEVAEEVLYRAALDPSADPASVSAEDVARLLEELRSLCRESSSGRGYLVLRDGAPVEAVPFRPLRIIERGLGDVAEYASFDEALDELFSAGGTVAAVAGGEKDPELARLEESLRRAEERARQYRDEAERLRRLADAVSRAYDRMAELMSRANRGEKANLGKVSVEPMGGRLVVRLGEIRVEVPRGSGPERVVVELYRIAGEMDAKAERALQVRGEVEKRLEELRLKAMAREIARKAQKRRRYWYEKFHWTITRGGMLAVGGRDASQNEAVVKKYLGPSDIFMHANIHGAPAVVLRTGGREPSEEDLYDAAVITAAYSKAWKAGAGSVEVYWAKADQVSFSPPSGEYLAKGGIMVYGRKRYLPRPVPVRLALGIALNEEGVPVVFQGSEETVRQATIVYAVLAPGDMGKEEVAEELRKRFASALPREQAPLAYAVSKQEVMPRIPGRARILRISHGEGRGIDMRRAAGEA